MILTRCHPQPPIGAGNLKYEFSNEPQEPKQDPFHRSEGIALSLVKSSVLIGTAFYVKNPLGRMPCSKSRNYRSSWQSLLSRPLRERHRLSIVRNENVVSPVVHLIDASSPQAIRGLVIPAVLSAFECHAGWRLSHICKEVFKRLPSFANGDTATSIVRKTFGTGITTSTEHCLPNAIDARGAHGMRSSARSSSLLDLIKQASARLGIAVAQATGNNRNCISTDTATYPLRRRLPAASDFFDCSKSPEGFADKDWGFHIANYAAKTYREQAGITTCLQ